MKRSAGILLSVSSLPSAYGIGCFDESAYRFVDWLVKAGQSYWQILPLGPTGYGDSPYQSFSSFAGNPYFICLDGFVEEGLLTRAECDCADLQSAPDRIDYGKLYHSRYRLLKRAYQNSSVGQNPDFKAFCREAEWLDDYALFMALKDAHHGKAWGDWEADVRLRSPSAIEESRAALSDEIGFHQFLQFHFYRQWSALKSYANRKGIKIIGDIPIYVALDSADAWANPALFQFDGDNRPIAVAGCPPDGFSADGQLWGNPLYDWDVHRASGYRWWTRRLAHCFGLYDALRIDHFRGFDEYYAIPYGSSTAKNGRWKKGPGIGLFRAVENAIGKKEVIAEDLGFMTDSVKKLVRDSAFPNMKVLEFAFDARDTGSRNDHLPHNYGENCVAYTGTHDNQTLASWYKTITEEERKLVRDYLCDDCTPDDGLGRSLIALILRSRAALCIIPMQDWLGLDDRSRMNRPSTVGGNWQWRMSADSTSDRLADEICRMTRRYGR